MSFVEKQGTVAIYLHGLEMALAPKTRAVLSFILQSKTHTADFSVTRREYGMNTQTLRQHISRIRRELAYHNSKQREYNYDIRCENGQIKIIKEKSHD